MADAQEYSQSDNSFEAFLISREISESVIKELRDQKIDEDTIICMQDEMLAKYIEKLGDRIAIRNFCERKDSLKKRKTTKKSKLFETLKFKLSENSSKEPVGRKPRKLSRKCEIGWIHNIKQVRKRSGGGTRKLDMPVTSVKADLLRQAQDLFFPGGLSPKGHISLFDIDLLDFKETPLPENVTLNDCYDRFKTGLVSFYLNTRDREVLESPTSAPDEFACESTITKSSDLLPASNTDPSLFLTSEEMMLNNILQYQFQQETSESTYQTDACTAMMDTGTPTVTFNIPSGSSQEGNVHHDSSADDSKADPMDDDSVVLYDDSFQLPKIQYRSRRNLSMRKTASYQDISTIPLGTISKHSDAVVQVIESKFAEPTTENVIITWAEETLSKDYTDIIIHRRKVLDSTKRALSRPNFNFYKKVKIVFAGELGDDLGGPKREYFRLLMQAMKEQIMNGSTFQHSVQKLDDNMYEMAGKLVAWSILNGGPGLPVFCPAVAEYIIGGTVTTPATEDTDEETRQKIAQTLEASDISAFDTDWIVDQGVTGVITVSRRQEIVDMILKNTVIYRVSAEAQQFRDGLDAIGGLLGLMQKYQSLKNLLVKNVTPLTAGVLKSIYTVDFSDAGSNARQQEEDTIYAFECFLQDCEDGSCECKLIDVLVFWTGADHIPPAGFPNKLRISFVRDNLQANYLPVAHTCGMVLEIPRGLGPEDLRGRMVKALQWGGEFHLA